MHVLAASTALISLLLLAGPGLAQDSDGDGLPDAVDSCPRVIYTPAFDWRSCPPMDLDPTNDPTPQGKARERVAAFLSAERAFVRRIAFSIVVDGQVHFADAFEKLADRTIRHDPAGIHRLFRIGSTTKPIVAVAAKVLEEAKLLSLSDYVNDDDGTQLLTGGKVTLRQLLSHRGAFRIDSGVYLFGFPGDLASFWKVPDDRISPHYTSPNYGNLNGGYEYSAFNYSLAGAYLENRTIPFAKLLQLIVFDRAKMATASLDGSRANTAPIGGTVGVTNTSQMHLGPYINLVAPTDPYCADNFYSSDDLYGKSSYSQQSYHLDECASQARDPAGGVIASVIDMAHFASGLIASHHGTGRLVSQQGIRDLWAPTHDFQCGTSCTYQRYYGTGFFVSAPSTLPSYEVEHGGSRAGYDSVFVIRPEAKTAVSILVNGNVDLNQMNRVAKQILDDLASSVPGAWIPYGTGCPLASPTLSTTTTPLIGQLFKVDLMASAKSTACLFLLGDSKWEWDALPLPLDLSALGAHGCTLLAAGHLMVPALVDGNGSSALPLAIPSAAALVGKSLFVQSMVLDASANAFGWAFTPGGEIRIGRS